MKTKLLRKSVFVFGVLLAAAVTTAGEPAGSGGEGAKGKIPFDGRLKEIAASYTKLSKVAPGARWAPTLCQGPPPSSAPLLSASDDTNTHGQKLYFLFAAKKADYLKVDKADSPIGQVLVKEAYRPEEVSPPARRAANDESAAVGKDGKLYQPGKKAGLFVMFKVDPKTEGTDQGWVYGTITPEGEVTAGGKIESCIACHRDATRDRLFGLSDGTGRHPAGAAKRTTGSSPAEKVDEKGNSSAKGNRGGG